MNKTTVEDIERIAHEAFSNARQATLDAGLPVTERRGNDLVVVGPGGNTSFIKHLEPMVSVTKGSVIQLPPEAMRVDEMTDELHEAIRNTDGFKVHLADLRSEGEKSHVGQLEIQ